ncbi:hypothetical protein [Croceimicrobium hydrocarbonivorans]|uniref:Uncharacterized protein n=1 Tax=Croceimicrobium hydrocarbonivorans TaxID=2761580 RepID=A0A7H0VDN4_9FLAO|nr:hypothetical protein [Croceimicrobium hydrocarbonivorans]QNR23832.1 hypothetical protein H4K34_15860 [Croceimicrobium hydrocarbonivorans]
MKLYQDLSLVTDSAYNLASIINDGKYDNILYYEFHEKVEATKIINCLEGLESFTARSINYYKIFNSYGIVDEFPAIIHIAVKLADEWFIASDCGSNYYLGYGPSGILKLREACAKKNVMGIVSECDFDKWLTYKFGKGKKYSENLNNNKDLIQFQKLIKSLQHLTAEMQRKPSEYQNLQEENLRDKMLTPLNVVFKGRINAEAKNNKGKTDILLRTKDGLNEYIFELKVWGGIRTLKKAIDQLQGYLSWHNKYSGIVMFCYNSDFTSVLNKSEQFLKDNYSFEKRGKLIENEFRFRLVHPTDRSKTIELHLIFINLKTTK